MKWSVNDGRTDRSQTKSKTCSRGAEIVAETLTSRMRGDRTGPGGKHGCAAGTARGLPKCGLGRARRDSQAALARVHPLRADGVAAVLGQPGEAEVAQDPAALELVHPLAGERRAPALAARRG